MFCDRKHYSERVLFNLFWEMIEMQAKWTNDLDSKIYEDALSIRYKVFVEEQGFPLEVEVDDLEDQSDHVVLYEDELPIAVARMFTEEDGVYTIGRVAVLKSTRTKGLGALLMAEVENKVREYQGKKMFLNSQQTVVDFYKKCGFENVGDTYLEHDVPHQKMQKVL